MTDAEDRKPQSDEARNVFVPPSGVAAPADSESQTTSEFAVPDGLAVPKPGTESETTSEFALPDGLDVTPPPPSPEAEGSAFSTPKTYSARQAAAFTPPAGVPLVRLTKDVPWQDRMRTMLRMPVTERPAPEPVQRHDEAGPAVPRVLDLSLRIGELLLAGGEGAEDVEAAMFAVCRSYGLDRCEPNVTFTLLAVSYQPSLVDDPVTASRTVRRRSPDYTRLAAVYQLVDDLSDDETQVSLEEAYRRLAEMRRNRHPYPGWALTAASGLLAGSASVLVGGGLLVFVAAAVGAMLGDRLAWLCAGRGLPEFYQFTVAATPPAAIGVALTLAHADVKASAVITGGLFALLPGRALVAGVQDGLTGFYITASARLLEVLYFFVAIVIGVLTVLYFGVQLGAKLVPDAALGGSDPQPVLQIAASLGLSLAFAVLLQQERATVLMVTLNGGIAWVVYGAMQDAGGISPVASTAVAAGVVGLFGQLLARYRFASALPYTTAAIGPLLPGSATYFGLLGIAQNEVNRGLTSLTKAVALAMAIAIGVNLGSEISRLFLRIGSAEKRRAAKRTRGF
ncbi:threonine/serine exporter family protein [Streptomyces sp. Vc74B-19]|uniref:threonine/serine exporter family protein n=1 Tax=unclassified Streptomyces TaxID=2593676 RepID=UPI001BFC0B81|nr:MULTISPECIES: threonine/serine exporter family protein [unclassified Streptomyces]MBT3163469.1 threonine/serine exporter family protein [Streptomyces sp. Vc74B-19]MCO4697940.1 threonine/serine exporter family protein [Streptomyces sp. RO-S4]MDU0301471.1 threonine/serine exporter family protein [Streptomyces sp. PAL114]